MNGLLLLLTTALALLLAPPAQAPQLARAVPPIAVPEGQAAVFFLTGAPGSAGGASLRPVSRPGVANTPAEAVALLLDGPTQAERATGLWSAFPSGTRLLHTGRIAEETVVDVSDDGGNPAAAAAQVAATLAAFPRVRALRLKVNGRSVRALLRTQFLHPTLGAGKPGAFGSIEEAGASAAGAPVVTLQAAPEPEESLGLLARMERRLSLFLFGRRRPRVVTTALSPAAGSGPLAGKVIVISGGHGLTRFASGKWRYQRSYFHGLVEDEVNARFAIQAAGELRRLGATVYLTRAGAVDDERGSSGAPRWTEAAKYYLRDIGVPDWVTQAQPGDFDSDIDSRPLYANYLNADLLISIHNNDGDNSGTLTLYDTVNGFAPESERLANALQRHVVRAIRGSLNGNWHSLGVQGSAARYGENHWAQMPSALVEVAFMNRRRDRDLIGSIGFRETVGRAVAAAVAEYFGVPDEPLLPEPKDSAAPVRVNWPAAPPVIACVGSPTGTDLPAVIERLQARLQGTGQCRLVRAGTNKEPVGQIVGNWDREVRPLRPSVVVIAPGRPELAVAASGAPAVPTDRFEEQVTDAVRWTRAQGAMPVLVTLGPVSAAALGAPPPAGLDLQALRDAYNRAIRRVAANAHTSLADVSRAAWNHEAQWLAPDGRPAPGEPDRLAALLAAALPLH